MKTPASVTRSLRAGIACAFVSIVLPAVPVVQAAPHVLQFTAGDTNAPITTNYITLDSPPVLNGKPTLKPIITRHHSTTTNPHPVGVKYIPAVSPAPASAGRWSIYNEDGAAMPSGALFNVLIPAAATKVNATPLNSIYNLTALPTAKSKPDAILLFTHMWNPYPKLGFGVDAHYQALGYPASIDPKNPLFNKWFIYNIPLPDYLQALAASYFIVDTATIPAALGAVKLHHTSSSTTNIFGNETLIIAPEALRSPTSVVFISPVSTTYSKPFAVSYNTQFGYCSVISDDGTSMPSGLQLNVLMFPGPIP